MHIAIPAEDVETVIKAGNIVPKPLPQVTPDACPSPAAAYGYRMPGQRSPTPKGPTHHLVGLKRRNSNEIDENAWQMAKRMAPNRFVNI